MDPRFVQTPDFENSDLWTHGLLPINLCLRTDTGIQWSYRNNLVDHLCHVIVLDCCTIMQAYAEIASRFELREAVTNSTTLPTNMFEPAHNISKNLNRKLNNAVHSWTVGDYLQVPHTYDFMVASSKKQQKPSPPERNHERNHGRNHERNQLHHERNQPERKKKRQETPDNDNKKQLPNPGPRKGLTKFTGTGKLPPLAIVDKHHNKNQMSKNCYNSLYDGSVCARGDTCNLLHLSTQKDFDKLEPENKKNDAQTGQGKPHTSNGRNLLLPPVRLVSPKCNHHYCHYLI
jgi:hypothetical protein